MTGYLVLVYTWRVFHKAGLRKSLAYFNKSGLITWKFHSINVAYMNPCWVTVVTYAGEQACSLAG